jgi:hypothetical protein
MMKTLLTIIVLALVIVSCEKDHLNPDITQPVVFEYEYINHAWIYTHIGWMIDEEGKIHGFNLPDKWNIPDETNHLTKADLIENLSQSDTLFGNVNNTVMLHHFKNRFDFPGNRMDTSDIFMADAGIGTIYAYVWDQSADAYERILLASNGDISVTNTGSEAKSAARWLKDVGKKTDRFYWFGN